MANSITKQRRKFLARHTISSDQVYQGAVLWLPECRKTYFRHQHIQLDQIRPSLGPVKCDVYGHPILILSRPHNDASKIHFVVLTSLGETRGLRTRSQEKIDQCPLNHFYLPVEPSEVHKCYESRVRYRDGLVSSTGGYVSSRAVYTMEWANAQPHADFAEYRSPTKGPWVLEGPSTELVLDWAYQHYGYKAGVQFQTNPVSACTASSSRVGSRDEPSGDPASRPSSLIARVGRGIVSRGRESWSWLSE